MKKKALLLCMLSCAVNASANDSSIGSCKNEITKTVSYNKTLKCDKNSFCYFVNGGAARVTFDRVPVDIGNSELFVRIKGYEDNYRTYSHLGIGFSTNSGVNALGVDAALITAIDPSGSDRYFRPVKSWVSLSSYQERFVSPVDFRFYLRNIGDTTYKPTQTFKIKDVEFKWCSDGGFKVPGEEVVEPEPVEPDPIIPEPIEPEPTPELKKSSLLLQMPLILSNIK